MNTENHEHISNGRQRTAGPRNAASGRRIANNYIFTDAAELDVTDAGAVRRAAEQTRAEAIVNCAAYTDVERAEENEAAADRLNRLAPANLAAAAAATEPR